MSMSVICAQPITTYLGEPVVIAVSQSDARTSPNSLWPDTVIIADDRRVPATPDQGQTLFGGDSDLGGEPGS